MVLCELRNRDSHPAAVMIVQCAWCGRLKADGAYAGPRRAVAGIIDGHQVSHGICPDCYSHVLRINGYEVRD